MDGATFLQHVDLAVPLDRRADDFVGHLQLAFNRHQELLDTVTGTDPVSQAIVALRGGVPAFSAGLLDAVVQARHGSPTKAYSALDGALQGSAAQVAVLHGAAVALKRVYRVRVRAAGESGLGWKRPDLFHVPFQMRHKVPTARFSVPGLPCLYLGSTVFVVWLEFGEPPLENLMVSRFETAPDEEVRFLDLGYYPAAVGEYAQQNMKAGGTDFADLAVAYALTWPLMAACLTRVKHRGEPFIEEYIVPQLLTQWVCDQDEVDGIRFLSTRIDGENDGYLLVQNYAFPARAVTDSGHCARLTRQFHLTEPLSLGLVETLVANQIAGPLHGKVVGFAEGSAVNYGQTRFGRIESRLATLTAGGT